jgi:protocatechuate 3,4-dioxygenase beta subunit
MSDRTPASRNRRQFLRAALALSPGIALAACSAPAAAPASPPTAAPTQVQAPATKAAMAEAAVATAAPTDAMTPAATSDEAATAAPSAAVAQPAATLQPVAQAAVPTPACGDDDDPTPPQTAGPFYTPNAPQRASFLEPGIVGTRMVLSGFVLDTSCKAIPGAMLDVWHADDAGQYDNSGYKLRGHFFADENGRYSLETIVPGLYPGRTRHFHVRVQAPNQPVLTTQLYFPNEPGNARDGIYQPELEMVVEDAADGSRAGAFDFVLQLR